MMLPEAARADTENGVSVAKTLADMGKFLDPACGAMLWHRQLPRGFQDWIDRLEIEALPRGRIIVTPQEVRAAFTGFCDMASMPAGMHRDWLTRDVTALAQAFAEMMAPPYLRLRVEAVTTNSCRKFHVDAITARLVCTYRGPGTQYGISHEGADPSQVFDIPTGAPILLRGTLWPPEPPTQLLHRSPPIEGTGMTRLVLVLDPVFDLEDEI